MADFIDARDEFRAKQSQDLTRHCTKSGLGTQETNAWVSAFRALTTPAHELDAQRSREGGDCRQYIKDKIMDQNGSFTFSLQKTTSLYHWIESIKSVSHELQKPIRLVLPIIVATEIPQLGYFEQAITNASNSDAVCRQFHRTENAALLQYLESPEGRRMIIKEANTPSRDGKGGHLWTEMHAIVFTGETKKRSTLTLI